MEKIFDVIVLGGSYAGFLTALKAAQKGLKTAIVEENRIGGIKTMAAEMPISLLLENDKTLLNCLQAGENGLNFSGASFDPNSFYERIRENAEEFSRDLVQELKENGVSVYLGRGTVLNDRTVSISREDTPVRVIGFKDLIYAEEPVTDIPEKIKDKLNGFYTNENFGLLDTRPDGLIIYGTGERSLQAALIWSALGTQVYLASPESRLLKNVSEEVEEKYIRELEKRDVEVFFNVNIDDIYQDSSGVFHLQFVDDNMNEMLTGSDLFVLTDEIASTKGLEALDLKTVNGWLPTSPKLRTDNAHIYTWTASEQSKGNNNDVEQAADYLTDVLSNLTNAPYRNDNRFNSLELNPPYYSFGNITESEDVVKSSYPENFNSLEEDNLTIYMSKDLGDIVGAEALGPNAKEIISTVAMLIYFEGISEELLDLDLPEDTSLDILKTAVKQALKDLNEK